MKRYSLLIPGAVLLCFVSLLIISELNSPAKLQAEDCDIPPQNALGTSWRVNATVNVVIDPSFDANTQRPLIIDQLNKWGNKGIANVTFQVGTSADAGPGAIGGGNPILFITKTNPADMNSPTAQGSTGGFSYNGCRGDSEIKINQGLLLLLLLLK